MSGEFDVLAHLERKRREAKEQATALLWENIEGNNWWFEPNDKSETSKSKEKIKAQFHHYHPALVSLHIAFSGTVMELVDNDIHNILQYGAARRISSIYSVTKSFARLAYPEREEVLSQDESRRLSDDLLLIYVHMVGVLDAFGIALHRLKGADIKSAEKHADILKAKFRRETDFVNLEDFFGEHDKWFTRIKDDMRNRYVHRVPPYVAPAVFNQEDANEYERLQGLIYAAMRKLDVETMDTLREQQRKLGRFSPFISFIDSDQIVYLSPTVLDDVMRFQAVVLTIFEEIIPKLEFKRQIAQ